jgi:hypothetical protein
MSGVVVNQSVYRDVSWSYLLAFSAFFGCTEATCSLLVHLSTRCNAINCQHDALARASERKDAIHVREDGSHHGWLVCGWSTVLRVAAGVDDAVHVKVEVVKLQAWYGISVREK